MPLATPLAIGNTWRFKVVFYWWFFERAVEGCHFPYVYCWTSLVMQGSCCSKMALTNFRKVGLDSSFGPWKRKFSKTYLLPPRIYIFMFCRILSYIHLHSVHSFFSLEYVILTFSWMIYLPTPESDFKLNLLPTSKHIFREWLN